MQKSISPKRSKEHIAFSSSQTNESIGPLGHMIQNIFHGWPWFQSQKTISWHMNLLSLSHLLYVFCCSFFKAFCSLPNLLKFVHILLIFFPWSLLLYSLYGSHASMHKIKVLFCGQKLQIYFLYVVLITRIFFFFKFQLLNQF